MEKPKKLIKDYCDKNILNILSPLHQSISSAFTAGYESGYDVAMSDLSKKNGKKRDEAIRSYFQEKNKIEETNDNFNQSGDQIPKNKSLWIARDRNGELFIYKEKPDKGLICWETSCDNDGFIKLDLDGWFPEVKWGDKEPTELILK